jgi:hypothetical protein
MTRRPGLYGLLAATCLLGCGVHVNAPVEAHEHHGGMAYSDDREVVQIISALIGGKNVFVPATVVLTEGEGRALSVFNTTDIPHGFSIPGLGIETILPPGEELRIPLPRLEGGHIHAIRCHVHPPHRSATLVVLPAAPVN